MGGPLTGTRVFDLSQAWSGPYCSMLLADAGADVIKVESPEGGDHVRNWTTRWHETLSPHFVSANRGKRSVSLNLKRPEGKALALRLLATCDILLENFRPGVMDRLGLDYAAVKAVNPRIIYCSVSGFGQSGPLSHRPAYDLIASGYGGVTGVTGTRGGRPLKPGVPVADVMGAMTAACSILMALLHRQQTGEGCQLDISMMDTQLSLMAYHMVYYQLSGRVPGPLGSEHPLMTPYQSYRTATFEINVACLLDKHWQLFCQVLGREDWLHDPRFATNVERVAHRDELTSEIEAILTTRDGETWIAALEQLGVPCGPINTVDRLLVDPHLEQRGIFIDWDYPGFGRLRLPGAPWQAPGMLADGFRPPPELGEHTRQVLTKDLGLAEGELLELARDGVVSGKDLPALPAHA